MADGLRRLGLLGGMSWQSTSVYYGLLNSQIAERVGGHASAPVTVWSVDFAEIEKLQRAGDWDAQGRILREAAQRMAASGAEFIALATNTLHLVADEITRDLEVPFIDLIDVVGEAASSMGYRRVGLLGTGYTMTSDLFQSRLKRVDVEVLVPAADDRATVHRIIFQELVHGIVSETSKQEYLAIIGRLAAGGAEAIILGCTEIGLLVADGDADIPLLDTTRLHCDVLVTEMLKGTS